MFNFKIIIHWIIIIPFPHYTMCKEMGSLCNTRCGFSHNYIWQYYIIIFSFGHYQPIHESWRTMSDNHGPTKLIGKPHLITCQTVAHMSCIQIGLPPPPPIGRKRKRGEEDKYEKFKALWLEKKVLLYTSLM